MIMADARNENAAPAQARAQSLMPYPLPELCSMGCAWALISAGFIVLVLGYGYDRGRSQFICKYWNERSLPRMTLCHPLLPGTAAELRAKA
ncbi:hypothetical protein J3P77_13780 [Pseudomonas sp. R1-18]|uniref:hypothetical protein n=1 Tax=Pseudomonas sp. R1-18 TaxID=1632772 RepID=UPI003DA9F375